MNIEIAHRLVELRKKHGYTQEELADKLGLSRQAVSKWERAEASPDTDNLIVLAKLYGVSLDELLDTEQPVEDIVRDTKEETEQQEKKAKEEESSAKGGDKVHFSDEGIFISGEDGEKVHFDKDGIHVVGDEGERVEINGHHVHVIEKDGNEIHRRRHSPGRVLREVVTSTLIFAALIAYMLLGFLADLWAAAWVLFLVPFIVTSVIRCIQKRRFTPLAVPLIAVFVYFFVCMWVPGRDANLWGVMWVVFLGIPLYYAAFSPIDRHILSKDEEIEVGAEVDEDDDD